MSLNKAIEHNKEKRKPYRGAKAHCTSCRNHGSCDYCRMGRLHSAFKRLEISESKLSEYFEKSK